MIQTYRDSLKIYFGNKRNEINITDIKQSRYCSALQKIVADMSLQKLIVLDQQHIADGLDVDDYLFADSRSLFEYQGDFLVTRLKNCGLVVLSADCLPVVLYDVRQQVVGIAHSGWKGSSDGVVPQTFKMMQNRYNSIAQDIEVFFGASAGTCCYEVSFDFSSNFESYGYADQAFLTKNNKLYFDNRMFVEMQLKEFGIRSKQIYNKQTVCTICSEDQSSARREKERAGRQATVVALI